MLKKFIAYFLTFFCFVPSVFATTWVEIDKKLYIDTDSIEYTKNYLNQNEVTFWVKSLNNGSNMFKDLEQKYKKKVWYSMNRYVINCDVKEIGLSDAVDYDLKRYPIKTYYFGKSFLSAIIPDSFGEYYYNLVCPLK